MKRKYKILKTIQLLSENSRISTKKLSKEINTTQQNASYILNKLKEEKVVKSHLLLVDSSKFKLNNFTVLLRLNQHSKSTINTFTTEIKKYKEITGIETLFGSYDIFLKFTTPNTSYFNKILKEILTENKNLISNYQILTQIVEYNFPKNYLSRKKIDKTTILAGDRKAVKLDNLDKKIVNLLNENARTNFSKIANELKTTSKTIIERVKKLEKSEIIKGYGIEIDYNKIKLQKKYLKIKTNLQNIEKEKKFLFYLRNHPNVTNIIKVFGNWDMIITIETLKEEAFKEILFDIKDTFSNFIENYDFLESVEIKQLKYISKFEI